MHVRIARPAILHVLLNGVREKSFGQIARTRTLCGVLAFVLWRLKDESGQRCDFPEKHAFACGLVSVLHSKTPEAASAEPQVR
jgi:hypothetical protein